MLCVILLLIVYILATVPLTAQDETTKFRAIECESIMVKNPTDTSKMAITRRLIMIRNEGSKSILMIGASYSGDGTNMIQLGDKDRLLLMKPETLTFAPTTDSLEVVPKADLKIGYHKVVGGPHIMLSATHSNGTLVVPGSITLLNENGTITLK
jgi:hypothetical protein